MVGAGDRRARNRSRSVPQSSVGNSLCELVHLRYGHRWRGASTLVYRPGPGGARRVGVALKIYQNVDGNFNAPPITTAQVIGSAILSFDTCNSGQLTYQMIDGTFRSGVIPLSRLTPNTTCSTTGPPPTNADFEFSGNWFNAATSGRA